MIIIVIAEPLQYCTGVVLNYIVIELNVIRRLVVTYSIIVYEHSRTGTGIMQITDISLLYRRL